MSELPELRFDIPHSARVWNYWLGGKDNYEADRKVGDAILEVYPAMRVLARQTRLFLRRSVRYLAGPAGVDQFLDIGTGLPTMENTPQVAQQVEAASRIVYVDNDPLVLAHARSLMVNVTPQGHTTYLHADVREPDAITAQAREHLDFERPIAVIMLGILGTPRRSSTTWLLWCAG
ncbi:SAM-dependent methyltransferase [Actinomycetes bacterium KLBMP 9759]